MSEPLLDVQKLDVSYTLRSAGRLSLRPRTMRAVQNVSFAVAKGQVTAVVGESGSGKSTIARAICGLARFDGSVKLGGRELAGASRADRRSIAQSLQMVFQDPYSSLDPSMTIGTSIEEPLEIHTRLSRTDRRQRVAELLHAVNLPGHLADRYPSQLSGGQRQRVAIARAIALKPDLLICDEAVSSLDVSNQTLVVRLLKGLVDELGMSTVFITHDLTLSRFIADRVAVLYLGELVEEGPVEAIFDAPAHPYTEGLLNAVPVPDPVEQRSKTRVTVSGEPPSALARPSGCPFHTRCPYVMDICRTVKPAETPLPGGRRVRCHLETTGQSLRRKSAPAQI